MKQRLDTLKILLSEKTQELQVLIDEFKYIENTLSKKTQIYETICNRLVELDDRYTGTIETSFLNYFQKWSFNRQVDKKRVECIFLSMEKNYLEKGSLPSSGIITACLDGSNYIRIIDGQHRCEAYKLFTQKHNLNFSFPVDIYKYENDNKMLEVFNIINNIKLVEPDFLNIQIQEKVQEIAEKINKKFKTKVIKDRNKKTNTQVRRPYLDKPNFVQNLIKKKGNLLLNTDTEYIVKTILEINNGIGNLDRKYRADKYIDSNIHLNSEKMGFYLGLDKKLSWIENLN
jgi:hypothetical protein